MEMEEGMILISADEYAELVKKETILKLITDILFGNAILSLKGERLLFNTNDGVHDIIKALHEYRYTSVLADLRDEEERKRRMNHEGVTD